MPPPSPTAAPRGEPAADADAATTSPPPATKHRDGPWLALAGLAVTSSALIVLAARGDLPLVAAIALTVAACALAALALERNQRRRESTLWAAAMHRESLAEERRLEAIGRLAGGIAHDTNNYLAAIRAQCELVLRKEQPREVVVRRMDMVVETVIKAAALLDRLLAVARRQATLPEPLRLDEVIENLLVLLRGSLRPDLTVRSELPGDLPPVWFDLAQLEQCLTNLLVNAADATPPPGGTIVCSAREVPVAAPALLSARGHHDRDRSPPRLGAGRAREGSDADAARARPGTAEGGHPAAGSWIEVAIRDTGHGIPPEVLPHIFDPFFTTKSGHGASGLGLATVRALIEQAGGSVAVESTPGLGTTFRLLLPTAPRRAAGDGPTPSGTTSARQPTSAAAPSPAGSPSPAPLAAASGTAGGAARILLVDDYPELRAAAASHLRNQGHQVTECGSSAEALACAEREPPFAVVVTDVRLGDGSGPDLVARLRERGPLAALYMSGYTDRIALRGAGRGGARDEAFFLKKPFSAEGLGRMVGELLAAQPSSQWSAQPSARPDDHAGDPQAAGAPDGAPAGLQGSAPAGSRVTEATHRPPEDDPGP